MSYKVDKFNGTFLVNVADGSIDTTTDLRLIGKNYAGYGEVQNENFLHLMENFANTSAPPKAIVGQLWYDSTATQKKLKFYDGTQWKVTNGATSQSTPPSGLTSGDFWFDTSTKQLYTFFVDNNPLSSTFGQSEFVLVGPEQTPDLSATSIVPAIVKDTVNTNHNILKVNVQNETVAVISSTTFNLNSVANPISGFFGIKKGFTLINTPDTGITITDHFYWGTASVARGILGPNNELLDSSAFLLQSQRGRFLDDGIRIGDSDDLRIWIENGDIPVIENQNYNDSGNSVILRLRTGIGAQEKKDPLIANRNGVVPGQDNAFTLGATNSKWSSVHSYDIYANNIGNLDGSTVFIGNIRGIHKGNLLNANDDIRFDAVADVFYGTFGTIAQPGTFTGIFNGDLNGTASNATALSGTTTDVNATPNTIPIRDGSANLYANQFIGTADRANQLLVSDVYRSASAAQTANTIAVRDNNADITARIFNGTATSAQYADLAEKYLTDVEYEVGTVVSVGGTKEVTASSWGERAIGVVSANPAFMMNKDLEGGTYIALKGRVPVKVIGAIRKGQRLIAANNGCASAGAMHSSDVFAISLESSDNIDIKLIEAVV
jgi:hypothetical protein